MGTNVEKIPNSTYETIRGMTDEQFTKLFFRYIQLSPGDLYKIVQQTINPEVKNCPFCGAKGTVSSKIIFGPKDRDGYQEDMGLIYRYACPDPLCPGHHGSFYTTKEEALERWNRRAGSE